MPGTVRRSRGPASRDAAGPAGGGRRAREGRERPVEGAEGSADAQPRFGDEDGAPSEVPLAALGEVAAFDGREPDLPAPGPEPVTSSVAEAASATGEPAEAFVHQPVVEPVTTQPEREPAPVAAVTAEALGAADAPDERPPTAAVPASGAEGGADAAAEARAPRRPEPVSSELDPARPKRSGWWSRAKATLGG